MAVAAEEAVVIEPLEDESKGRNHQRTTEVSIAVRTDSNSMVSAAEEIYKFNELHRMGALSEEEFGASVYMLGCGFSLVSA